MIEPAEMIAAPPFTRSVPGLHKRTGLYGSAKGIVSPVVLLDRTAEGMPGFEALMFHEGLHVKERHALGGIMLLVVGILGTAAAFVVQSQIGALSSMPAALVAYILWRRECEVRADAFALKAVGAKEFLSFVLMHAHPSEFFWKWCYGRTPQHRIARAKARARRYGWAGS